MHDLLAFFKGARGGGGGFGERRSPHCPLYWWSLIGMSETLPLAK